MKKLSLMALVAFVLVSFTTPAAAQLSAGCAYVQGSYGHPARWACDPAESYRTERVVIIRAQQPGMSFRSCTASEEFARDGLMALRGGIAGVLIGDNRRAAGVGAGIGVLYSMSRTCQVAVPAVRREYFSNPSRIVSDDEVAYERRPRILGHQVSDVGSMIPCTLHSGVNGHEIKKTISVATPRDCEAASGFVEEAKQQVSEVRVSRRPSTPTTRNEGDDVQQTEAQRHGCKSQSAEWVKLNWPGHHQHEKFVCMEPGDTHRF